MDVRDFSNTNQKIISRGLQQLREEHGVTLNIQRSTQQNLQRLSESANNQLTRMRNTQVKYHRDPEYVKYMHIKTVCESMLAEGMYADSPNLRSLREMIREIAVQLLDRGYDSDEAEKECMNRYRQDDRFIYDDQFVLPLVQSAIMEYIDECNMESIAQDLVDGEPVNDHEFEVPPEEPLSDDYNLEGTDIMTLENKIQRALSEGDARTAKKLMKQLRERKIRVREGRTVKSNKPQRKENTMENMFRDVIAEMLNEEVNMDEAEVVMATQGMADDIQDVVEKVGRMANEDVVAIADKIRNERGADAAQQFTDTMTQALTSYMEAGRSAKQTIDQVITGLGSGDMAGVMGTGMDPQAGDDLGGELDDLAGGALGDDDLEMDDNVDAASGPVDEPLGRAEIG